MTAIRTGWALGGVLLLSCGNPGPTDGKGLRDACESVHVTRVASPVDVGIDDVWADGAHEAWAVGSHGVVLRWDGERWTHQATLDAANLEGVAEDAAGTPYAAGWQVEAGSGSVGRLYRHGPGGWTRVAAELVHAKLRGIEVDPDGTLYTFGEVPPGGAWLYRLEADEWSAFRTSLRRIDDVWAVSASLVFMVGTVTGGAGALAVFEDGEARIVDTYPGARLKTIAGVGKQVLAAGRRADGARWIAKVTKAGLEDQTVEGDGQVQALWGTSSDEVWAVDDRGNVLLREEGQAWRVGPGGVDEGLNALAVLSPREVVAVGEAGAIVSIGCVERPPYVRSPCDVETVGSVPGEIYGLSQDDDGALYLATSGGAFLYSEGEAVQLWGRANTVLLDTWTAPGGTATWMVGTDASGAIEETLILRCTRVSCAELDSLAAGVLTGVHGTRDDLVHAVGTDWASEPARSLSFRFDGTQWAPREVGSSATLEDVWVAGEDSVWAVAKVYDLPEPSGQIFHYDGADWQLDVADAPARLVGIAGRSAHDIFAVGINDGIPGSSGGTYGAVLHFDGSDWETVSTDSLVGYTAVEVTESSAPEGRAWLGSIHYDEAQGLYRPQLTSWNGGSFEFYELCPPEPVEDLLLDTDAGVMWLGGRDGTLYRRKDTGP